MKPETVTESGKICIPTEKYRQKDNILITEEQGHGNSYNIAGKVEQTGSYNNGRPDGLWKWYYETMLILREEEYFQGKRDGSSTEYSVTGEIIAQGQYSDGEKNGEWKYKSGNNSEEGKYITGLRDGIWKSYYPDGKLKFKGKLCSG